MDQGKNGGRQEAAATGNTKWDVWTSSWEFVCSGVLDLWVSE